MADPWRPDRSRGIFETLLVVAGEPVELEAHLERLALSLDAVYSQDLPPQAEEKLRGAAEGIRLGRLRLTVFPAQGMRLHTHPVSGGLGPHKWAHRPGIDRPAPGEAGALIVDEGEVLEAGWANIFAVRGGTLFTPPLDGRILPGTTRAALLALAAGEEIETAERPLSPTDLLTAEETFLTNSIRGIEPAEELDGQQLGGCGALSNRLAAALRQRWGLRDAPRSAATAPKPDLLSR